MKKWISIFVAVSLVLLLGISSIAAKSIADKANPGKICEDKGFLSQVISCEGKEYVIYKGTDQSKFQLIKTEKDLYQYETVGTINWDRVYYLYSFTEDAKQMLGVMPVSLVEEEVWEVPLLEMEGTFFAAIRSLIAYPVLISSMSKPVAILVILLVTIGFIVAVVGVSGGFLLNS